MLDLLPVDPHPELVAIQSPTPREVARGLLSWGGCCPMRTGSVPSRSVRGALMATLPEIRVNVSPDVTRLHSLLALIEKHAGALRADLEEWMAAVGDSGGV